MYEDQLKDMIVRHGITVNIQSEEVHLGGGKVEKNNLEAEKSGNNDINDLD